MFSVSSPYDTSFSVLLTESFKLAMGSSLTPDGIAGTAASWLYHAPFCLLAQDASADPYFVYANLTAQRCFGYDWQEFLGMPSRLSADAEEREQRQDFMDSVLAKGYVRGYRGRRVAKSGLPFWIEDATVWNLTDTQGALHGQAALFHQWSGA